MYVVMFVLLLLQCTLLSGRYLLAEISDVEEKTPQKSNFRRGLSLNKKPVGNGVCDKKPTLHDKSGSGIVGGRIALDGELPWQLEVINNIGEYGGATLIHPKILMTAGHVCVHQQSLEVYAGITKAHHSKGGFRPNPKEPCEQYRKTSKLQNHPKYNDQTLQHDICLGLLNTPFIENAYVSVAKLPSENYPLDKSTTFTVSGFGSVDGAQRLSPTLQVVNLPFIPDDECKVNYERDYEDNMSNAYPFGPDVICGGFLAGGKDACIGDSGGPLVVLEGDEAVVLGVVSYGKDCAAPGYPGVYTDVRQYLTWIKNTSIQWGLKD